MLAAESTNVPLPVLSIPPAPDTILLKVSRLPVTSIVLLVVKATGAVKLLIPVLVAKVPPDKVIGSATPVTLRRSKVAPLLTVVPAELDPNDPALVIARIPTSTVVAPVYVLAAERIRVPTGAPLGIAICESTPDPEITPFNV